MNPNPEPSRPAVPSATGAARSPGVVVRVPGPLRALTNGAGDLEVGGGTVAEVLDRLVDEYPGLRRHLLTEAGGVRDYVNVFVNEDDIRYLNGVATALGPRDTITIVPSIAGG